MAVKSIPLVIRRFRPKTPATYLLLAWLIAGRVSTEFGWRPRKASRRVVVPGMYTLTVDREFRLRPAAWTKSAVTTVLGLSSCDQPNAVCRV